MREIKFRIYNKQLKKYITLEEYQNLHAIEVETDGTLVLSSRYRFLGSMMICTEAFDVQQYAGLHDKNGKEIYEGDIVYCQTKFGKARAVIKFINGKFVAYWDSKITHPNNGPVIAYYDINKRFEVIGNVYNNKELLEKV